MPHKFFVYNTVDFFWGGINAIRIQNLVLVQRYILRKPHILVNEATQDIVTAVFAEVNYYCSYIFYTELYLMLY